LGGVVLLSPDMDVDLFRNEAARMGTLPRPFVIYGSRNDTALNLFSSLLTKDKPRLGSLPDPRLLEGLDLTYIDVRNVSRTPQIGHLVVATSPSMIAAINDMPKADLVLYAQNAKAGKIPGAIVERFGSMTSIVLPKQ
ncbi:MAG: alpha/beta hydrolase, partial [Devosia sp.]